MGAGFLLLSVLLALRELGIWFSDAIVWPLVLVARRRRAAVAPVGRAGATGAGPRRAPDRRREPEQQPEEVARERAVIASRTGLGVALVVAAGLVVPPGHRRADARPATWCSR